METPQEIAVSLEKIKNYILEKQILLDEIPKVLKREIPKILDEYFEQKQLFKPVQSNEKIHTTSVLELMQSSEWPDAVPVKNIVNQASDEQKTSRAEGILDFIVSESVKGKKFLDFGCNEGHVAAVAAQRGAIISVGYDVKTIENKWNYENLVLSDQVKDLQKHAPYDVVLLYDVLDHTENPEEVLKQIYELTNDNCQIFIRCHPWISRHGGHLYDKYNKAFLHLILNEEELTLLNLVPMMNLKITAPLSTYKNWANKAGFKVKRHTTDRQQVDPFFLENETIGERLKIISPNNQIPKEQMEISFIDMTLIK